MESWALADSFHGGWGPDSRPSSRNSLSSHSAPPSPHQHSVHSADSCSTLCRSVPVDLLFSMSVRQPVNHFVCRSVVEQAACVANCRSVCLPASPAESPFPFILGRFAFLQFLEIRKQAALKILRNHLAAIPSERVLNVVPTKDSSILPPALFFL